MMLSLQAVAPQTEANYSGLLQSRKFYIWIMQSPPLTVTTLSPYHPEKLKQEVT